MILVTGATGTVGREVVAQLVAAGQKVRILTRDPKKASFGSGAEVVTGDLGKAETLAPAMAGVDRVFALSGGPEMPKHDANVAQAAKKAGVKHIVKLSVMGAGTGADNPVVAWHDAGEKAIRESGVAWTFVRPGMFMSNALQWVATVKGQGKIFLPYGDGKIVPIHPKDIAAVAVKALTSAGHEGQAYSLTGGESLTIAEQAKILSEALGKPVEYVSITEQMAKDGMLKSGMPPALVEGLGKMMTMVRSGGAGTALPTVQQVLGRPPLTWRDWVNENVAAFR